jgi:hypothetical protein
MEPDPATAAARATAMVDTPPEAEVDADGGARAETPTAKGPPTCGDGARAATPAADAAAPPAAGRDDDGLPPPPPLSSQSRVLTPPTSEDMGKCDESSSELSELDMDVGREEADDEDIGDIEPDHYWDDGKIPVFKPVSGLFPNRSLRRHAIGMEWRCAGDGSSAATPATHCLAPIKSDQLLTAILRPCDSSATLRGLSPGSINME